MRVNKVDRQETMVEVDLTGPQGNGFALLGMARQWCRDLGVDYSEFSEQATAGDYEHLVSVMEEYFGDYVTFLE